MNFKEIQDLIKLINKTNLTEFKMKDGEFNISIKKGDEQGDKAIVVQQPLMQYPSAQMPVQQAFQAPAAPAVPATPAPETDAKEEKADTSNYLEVRSPIVGTFYRSASPENPPFAKVGDKISKGDVVCIVEAMKLFNEIETEVSGTIVQVMVEDAQPIEYDQVLFLVDPA
ncbi:MAG: acetyl-CoA carboxylase biotin carboxyl carrier protein [Saprospiraceae bacterium]|jgi:acetyl-CoA carboxylase biotin carboxyl carrier protein|nr:acetyl-CoA carboxylase biotin carboxyl carrier protein [Saprospiraceae bacterium]